MLVQLLLLQLQESKTIKRQIDDRIQKPTNSVIKLFSPYLKKLKALTQIREGEREAKKKKLGVLEMQKMKTK